MTDFQKQEEAMVDMAVDDATSSENEEININEEVSEPSTGETAEESQTSLGGLPKQNEPAKYRNAWTTAEVEVDQIQPYPLIKNFFKPTESDRASLARTPLGFFVLDGEDLVDQARLQGLTSIIADVDHMDAHSDEELCIRKMVLRLKTRGGSPYMEVARNSRDILQRLLNSNEDLKLFSHGGRRDHESLSGNPKDDAAEVLARRIRKDRDTVTKHSLHCRYPLTWFAQIAV